MRVGLAALNIGLTLWLRETLPHRPPGLAPGALRAAVRRALNPLDLWARLRRHDDGSGRLRRLVLTQVAFTLCIGNYFYFVPYLSTGPLRMNARDISVFFMYFGVLSIAINYGFYTFLADRINQHKAIAFLGGLGIPLLVGYGVVGTSWVGVYAIATIDCLTISLVGGLLEGLLARLTTDTTRGEVFGLNQAIQGLASVATTLVYGALSLLDVRLPWAWFAGCLGVVVWLATRKERLSPVSA